MTDTVSGIAIDEPAIGRRAIGKRNRRRRVMGAALELVSEVPIDEVTVKQIAARSGLSLATVYNLFGSKEGVVTAMFELEMERYDALRAPQSSQQPMAEMFATLDLVTAVHGGNPGFFRSRLWLTALGSALTADSTQNYRRSLRGFVEQMIAAGDLAGSSDAGMIADLLTQGFAGAYVAWLSPNTTTAEFNARATLGFAVSLYPFATAAGRKKLKHYMGRTWKPTEDRGHSSND